MPRKTESIAVRSWEFAKVGLDWLVHSFWSPPLSFPRLPGNIRLASLVGFKIWSKLLSRPRPEGHPLALRLMR